MVRLDRSLDIYGAVFNSHYGLPSGFFSSSCGLEKGIHYLHYCLWLLWRALSGMMSATVDSGLLS